MRLLDHITQNAAPFLVQAFDTGEITQLSGAADVAPLLRRCPLRYVLSDELTQLCTELAYSKGTQVLDCADLIHVPAELVWIEWCDAPWRDTLRSYGFKREPGSPDAGGRHGALVRALPCGLRGSIRSFWSSGDSCEDVHASAMEAQFYLDAPAEDAHAAPDSAEILRISDRDSDRQGVLTRCLHFEFEKSWANYYQREVHDPGQYRALQRHAAGTIAQAVPVLLAFFLLLATRTGLPQHSADLSRLNRARAKARRKPLLEHIEVRAPLLPEYQPVAHGAAAGIRRGPRLHHVRGHLVRRGMQLFWRVPHVRGRARLGSVLSRTITWTAAERRDYSSPIASYRTSRGERP
jgi:hypothetical protein